MHLPHFRLSSVHLTKSRGQLSDFHSIRSRIARLFILTCLLLPLFACKDDMTPEQRWLAFTTEQIMQGYADLADQASELEHTAADFCQQPDSAGLQKTQDAWRAAMASWQRMQWLRLGPITQENDDWKLQFWPDKKNILQRKAQELLDRNEIITADSLAHASVVVQGFSAQELLLFDPQFANPEHFSAPSRQCELLRAATERTAIVTDKLAASWQDTSWLERWATPAVSNPALAPAQVRNGELIDALLAQVERMKTDKLGEPMGLKNRDRKPNGYFAESWRSDNSLANLHNNLMVLQRLTRPEKGYGLFLYLKEKNQQAVADELVIRIDNAQLALRQIQPTLVSAVTQPDQQAALQTAYRTLGELASFIKQPLAPALGLTLGFNSNDGD